MLTSEQLVKLSTLASDEFRKIVLHDWDVKNPLYLCEVTTIRPSRDEPPKRWIVLQYDHNERLYHAAMPSNMAQRRVFTDMTVNGVVNEARIRMMRKMEAVSFFNEMKRHLTLLR
ncbi:hypothetical protein [Aeromonas caviae]|jgi:hypothetical protein|uniref:hypothetical protein n=1 Tax=Aeromonas caviae TaxID=648 RepID=UPI00385970BC